MLLPIVLWKLSAYELGGDFKSYEKFFFFFFLLYTKLLYWSESIHFRKLIKSNHHKIKID